MGEASMCCVVPCMRAGEDQRFTAEPLVYSPVGEYLRGWWESTRLKIGMEMNAQHSDRRYQEVLNGCERLVGHRTQRTRFPGERRCGLAPNG